LLILLNHRQDCSDLIGNGIRIFEPPLLLQEIVIGAVNTLGQKFFSASFMADATVREDC
jgi:hypothetical protein